MESEPNHNITPVAGGTAGFWTLLGLLFIALKLTGYVSWSWWLVLLPLYGPLVLFVALVALFVMVGMVALFIDRNRR